jgi:hypothetical protein
LSDDPVGTLSAIPEGISSIFDRATEQVRRSATANGFLQNRMLSPRHQTIIVASMTALGGIPGRAKFIAYASGADTEDAALMCQ